MRLISVALIVAIGLAAGGFLIGGRYEFIATDSNAVVRLDRYFGSVTMCVPGTAGTGCGFIFQNSN